MRAPLYDDENPPALVATDCESTCKSSTAIGDGNNNSPCTCPHYRALTTNRFANTAYNSFRPTREVTASCNFGGVKTRLGTHDIEDLVKFGADTEVKNDLALYKKLDETSMGLGLSGIKVHNVTPDGAAARAGLLIDDEIVKAGDCSDVQETEDIVNQIKGLRVGDPLIVSARRSPPAPNATTACPYILSQELAKQADIVFAPYNYILDPGIRNAMQISVENTVVIMDEAHNVEDVLRESGSISVKDLELMDLFVFLRQSATPDRTDWVNCEKVAVPQFGKHPSQKQFMFECVHEVFMLFERLIKITTQETERFVKGIGLSGAKGERKVRAERRFYKDDEEFECSYFGPGENVYNKDPRGCQKFFDLLKPRGCPDVEKYMDEVIGCAQAWYDRYQPSATNENVQKMMDRILDTCCKLYTASKRSEHFYVSLGVVANGNLSFALGEDDQEGGKRPKERNKCPNREVPCVCCNNDFIGKNILAYPTPADRSGSPVMHGKLVDGSRPKWLGTMTIHLLTPSINYEELQKCRTVVLASGTLSPIGSLAAELGLETAKAPSKMPKTESLDGAPPGPNSEEKGGKLQVKPPPLEAEHVINLQKQLFAVSVGYSPGGFGEEPRQLKVDAKNQNKDEFVDHLGESIVRVVKSIPRGGVLVFMPSYKFLNKCRWRWGLDGANRSATIARRLEAIKGKVMVEPRAQEDFENAKVEYVEAVKRGGCVLFAVYRGKMSEGVSFNDDNARGVICVGLPLPNSFSRSIKSKKQYNNEQRMYRGKTNLLTGADWYNQQAYRAIAQALGRCIRHGSDYGTVVLMDVRHCDSGDQEVSREGVSRCHENLPKWMRGGVRNLGRSGIGDSGVGGGGGGRWKLRD